MWHLNLQPDHRCFLQDGSTLASCSLQPPLRQWANTKNLQGDSSHLLSDENRSLKEIPISTANFKTIRDGDVGLYVDKTKMLFDDEFLVNKANMYNFIAHPRRFSKSLICSTIRELFSGDQTLFEGLYIHDKWDFEVEKRLVIHLDMSGYSMHSPQHVMDSLSRRR
jgi:hypothetical protein